MKESRDVADTKVLQWLLPGQQRHTTGRGPRPQGLGVLCALPPGGE